MIIETMFCNFSAENCFRAHDLNLEIYKIKSTPAYKMFSTLLKWAVGLASFSKENSYMILDGHFWKKHASAADKLECWT